jgi:hypothetical protein
VKWFIYGEVYFATTAKRNGIRNRLNDLATSRGFALEVWPDLVAAYGSWPAGSALFDGVSDSGATARGIRFCFSTTDQKAMQDALADVTAAWGVWRDTASWWGSVAAVT